MPWIYQQSTGELTHNGTPAGKGYSGHGEGVNNPAMEAVPDEGPIPRGVWVIGHPFDSPRLGPFVMALTPMPATDTYGRGGFFMHGDSVEHPGQECASEGCIIMSRAVREQVNASGDPVLEVV